MNGGALLLVLATIGPGAAAQRTHDLDGDGIVEALPEKCLVADFDGDGLLEALQHEGPRVKLSRQWPIVQAETIMEFERSVAELDARDVDDDGLLDLLVTLDSGESMSIANQHLPGLAATRHAAAAAGPGITPGHRGCVCYALGEVWNSGADLDLLWDSDYGYLDDDRRADLLGVKWPQPVMVVHENTGDNAFAQVFSTPTAQSPPGAFVGVAAGDTDGDGWGEIIGAETSTLNQVILYEATADNTYVNRNIGISEPDFAGNQGPTKVRIADADRDGKMEIIFDTSDSTGGGSEIYIYEHNGVVGSNTYTEVFMYSTVSYLVNFNVGDSDNDGNMEIVLGFGGFGGFPINLRRLENTGDNTYVHKITQPGGTGLALSPTVGDADGDLRNELVFGGVVDPQGGGVYIYESTADDTYTVGFAQGGLNGTGLSSQIGRLNCSSAAVVAVGSSVSELDLWRFAGVTYHRTMDAPLTPAGQVRSINMDDLDGDNRPDMMASSIGDDQIHVYEVSGHVSDHLGDLDGDGDVDLYDYSLIQRCYGGSGQPPSPYCPPGVDADLDDDGDVDRTDFAILRTCYTGPLP